MRQKRAFLVRYLGADLIESKLGVSPTDLDAWKAGDARVTNTDVNAVAYIIATFEHAARTFGLADAHEWFVTENAGLDGATPIESILQGHAVKSIEAAEADNPFEYFPLAALDMDGNPRVALAGDWHGNLYWAEKSLERLSGLGIRTVLHLGDFGLWPGNQGAKYIRRVTKACEEHDITIYVTDGSHEDHARLNLITPTDGVRWVTDQIGFWERGHRWDWGPTTFLSLGGAPSVDLDERTAGRDWWPEEATTDKDVARAIAGGPVDIMLTHDAPSPGTSIVEGIIAHNSQGWPADALTYAADGRARLTTAFHAVEPLLLAHGHFHVADRAAVRLPGANRDTQIVSLASDAEGDGNLAILDVETLGDDRMSDDLTIVTELGGPWKRCRVWVPRWPDVVIEGDDPVSAWVSLLERLLEVATETEDLAEIQATLDACIANIARAVAEDVDE